MSDHDLGVMFVWMFIAFFCGGFFGAAYAIGAWLT